MLHTPRCQPHCTVYHWHCYTYLRQEHACHSSWAALSIAFVLRFWLFLECSVGSAYPFKMRPHHFLQTCDAVGVYWGNHLLPYVSTRAYMLHYFSSMQTDFSVTSWSLQCRLLKQYKACWRLSWEMLVRPKRTPTTGARLLPLQKHPWQLHVDISECGSMCAWLSRMAGTKHKLMCFALLSGA